MYCFFNVLKWTKLLPVNCRNRDIENVITIDLHGQHVKPAMKLFKLHLLLGSYVQCKHFLILFYLSCMLIFYLTESKLYLLMCNLYSFSCVLTFLTSISNSNSEGYHRMWLTWCRKVKTETVGMGSSHFTSSTYVVSFV